MAPSDKSVIIIVMAEAHGNLSQDEILDEKIQDIKTLGHTCWYGRSATIEPIRMRHVGPLQVFIIARASDGPGDQRHFDRFTQWSLDGQEWEQFPEGLHQVTGSAHAGGYWAMVLDQFEPAGEHEELDLWDYSDQDGEGIFFNPFSYAAYATPKASRGMKSHVRRMIARGRLCDPYFVYIR